MELRRSIYQKLLEWKMVYISMAELSGEDFLRCLFEASETSKRKNIYDSSVLS